MTWFKFLAAGAVGPFSGFQWPAPRSTGRAGGWVEATGALDLCRNGVHACRETDLPYWLQEELYVVDLDGGVEEHAHLVVARRGRLHRRVDGWNRASAARFSSECAWRVRELTAHALERSGGRDEAEALSACTTLEHLGTIAAGIAAMGGNGAALLGYTADTAHFAAAADGDGAWCSAALTTGYVAAVAAGAAVGASEKPAATARERRRQAARIAGLARS